MAYRFVHAADIHLDSPLRSLAMRDPELAELIGTATRRSLAAIVDLCLAERVDALLIAGDLYDGEQTSMKTARFLSGQLHRLAEGGIRAFVIRGNHDAIAKVTKELTLPDGVTVFGSSAEAVEIEDAGGGRPIAIHGLSFAQPHAHEGLLPKYRRPMPDAVNIGLMHTSLGGAPGHDRYAPCAEADLHASGFDYWALGHVHGRTVYRGECTIVMPGMLQGRDIGEAGPKSVSLVTVADDGTIDVEERHTAIAQFERVPIDMTGCREWPEAVGRIEAALRAARSRARSEHLVTRLTLDGRTPLAWRFRRDADLLRTEAEQQASLIGSTWIDKVEVECGREAAQQGPGGSAVDELQRLIRDEVLDSEPFRAELAGIARELMAQLPAECRDAIGHDGQASDAIMDWIAREGSEDVLARLGGRDEGEGA